MSKPYLSNCTAILEFSIGGNWVRVAHTFVMLALFLKTACESTITSKLKKIRKKERKLYQNINKSRKK